MPFANSLKRNSKLFAAALLVALASPVAGPKPALAASSSTKGGSATKSSNVSVASPP
jgi:hypothetical protein